jgi:hypothetical protein
MRKIRSRATLMMRREEDLFSSLSFSLAVTLLFYSSVITGLVVALLFCLFLF